VTGGAPNAKTTEASGQATDAIYALQSKGLQFWCFDSVYDILYKICYYLFDRCLALTDSQFLHPNQIYATFSQTLLFILSLRALNIFI